MKKRWLELLVVLAAIAAVVTLLHGNPRALVPGSSPEPLGGSTPMPLEGPGAAAMTPAAAATSAPIAVSGAEASLWQSLYREAQDALAQGDNARAESRLLSALKVAPQAGAAALHETLDDLGLVSYRLGKYQESADYQKRAVEAAEQLSNPDRDATVALYESRYSMALYALDQRDEALRALARAEAAYKQAYPAGSPAYVDAMSDLAAQHRNLGDNEGAARLVEEP
jgi:tetratricopeptide (TPR) repeat protein